MQKKWLSSPLGEGDVATVAFDAKEEEASNLWHLSLALSQQGKTERAINYAEASLAIHE